jgi:hypothetical protein
MVKKMTKKNDKDKLELAVLLKNGAIYNNVQSLVFSQKLTKPLITQTHRTF